MIIRTWAVIGVLATTTAVAAGMAVGRAIWPQPVTVMPAAPLSPLYVAEDKLDLGEVWESKDAVLTVPISNRTNRDIEILDFETSCDCGEVSPRKLKVPARGSADVSVKMDLTRRTPQQIGMVRRKFTLQVRPVVAGRESASPLEVHWITRSAVTLNHTSVHFGEEDLPQSKPSLRTLLATAHEPIFDFTARTDSKDVSVAVREGGSGRWNLELRTTGSGTPGAWEAKVTISWRGVPGVKQILVDVSGRNVDRTGKVGL